MNNETPNYAEGEKQIAEIISKLLSNQKYLNFTFLNNVLSCEEFGETELWLHWGEIRMKENDNQKTAGDMKILKSWSYDEKSKKFSFVGSGKHDN